MARTKGSKNRPGSRKPGPRPTFSQGITVAEQLDIKHKIISLLNSGEADTITAACELIGVSPHRVYSWCRYDTDFADAVAAVREVVADKLEKELREHSNFIPKMFALKAYRREFRENYRWDSTDSKLADILKELQDKAHLALPPAPPAIVVEGQFTEITKVEESNGT